jgi:hypothetical protein
MPLFAYSIFAVKPTRKILGHFGLSAKAQQTIAGHNSDTQGMPMMPIKVRCIHKRKPAELSFLMQRIRNRT